MKFSEYPDEDLIQEIKHRGIKIEIEDTEFDGVWYHASKIKIGDVIFNVKS